MEPSSSSSKVTVEYFDPHGVYQLLSPGLLSRLPLRNLHWESHSGPLRSISSLHIDFTPSPQLSTPLSTTEAFSNATPITPLTPGFLRAKSEESTTTSDDSLRAQVLGQTLSERPDSRSGTPRPFVKERRHQIPGLRQTPYLKVLLLRCDDSDTYKSHTRRLVREWIKEHTVSSQSTSKLNEQESHDAFEWLIVHVVLPNTAAATQPRTSGRSSDGSSGSASTEKSRWRGGGSSTILDKLRADFNSSSKSAVDRVAQIRIGINDVPYEVLPRVASAVPGGYAETAQEHDSAWSDLISKFKSLILASFDMRVSQYEEDIREKDAQRALPGWNFCTFFMLKEGLARDFESVGLVEDALVGYDELAAGLDGTVRDQASSVGSNAEHSSSFLPYTKELKVLVERARTSALKDMGHETHPTESDDLGDSQSNDDSSDNSADEIPLSATKKRYRDLILSSNISIFDFRCYLFARQLSLLLRLANASSSQEELLARLKEQRESNLLGVATRLPAPQASDDAEDLAVLGEVCKRAMDFIASIARIMREDISASYLTFLQKVDDEDSQAHMDPITSQVVDNIVSSFKFSIAQQILAQTSTKALPIPPSTLAPPSSTIELDGQEPKASIPEPKTMMHPARSTSLALRSRSREPPSPGALPGARRASVPNRDRSTTVSSTFLKPGLEELAGHRAELYLLSRSVLEHIGRERGWSVGWAEAALLQYGKIDGMEDVDLNEEASKESNTDSGHSKAIPLLHGIDGKLLRVALDNRDDFHRLYETLTDKALRHYTVANHTQSVQSSMADLAVFKYSLEDYAAAASYLYRMTRFYGEDGWSQIELSMLVMYARCLKQLERKEEYVRVVLKLLSKAARAERERIALKSTLKLGGNSRFNHEEVIPDEPYLDELLQVTATFQREVQVPLQNLFSHVEVDDTPRYHSGKDSFALQLRFHYLLAEDMNIDKAKVKIVPVFGDSSREIWLESDGPILFKKGSVRLVVQSNAIIPDTYHASHVALYANNVVLRYERTISGPPSSAVDPFLKCPKLLIYHPAEAFDLKLSASRSMHLGRNRSLEVEISSGWNEVTSGTLNIRAATAGLRLQTSDTSVVGGTVEVSKKSGAGVIHFGSLSSGSKSKLRIPFSLEHEVDDISVRLETSYTTEEGDFFFATSGSVSIMLPLGVNVQDIFKHKALFSRFTISSASANPLRLLSSNLEGSEIFQAQCGLAITRPLVVFPRQPASILYKITKPLPKESNPPTTSAKDRKTSLSLTLHYICLEEEIDNAVTLNLHLYFKDTDLHPYIRLITSTVISTLHRQMSPYDVERTAVLSEISTMVLSTVRWREPFSGLGRTIQNKEDIATLIAKGVEKWQQETPIIALIPMSNDQPTISASPSITIPVEVPSVTVVHTANLRLLDLLSAPVTASLAAVTQPISASLDIKWTRLWDTASPPEHNVSEEQEDLSFVYEVSGPADAWLIGGRRKGHFKVPAKSQKQGQTRTLSFPVVLIPLREGNLPYPNVEIKLASAPRGTQPGAIGETGTHIPSRQAVITCETDYKNSGETIRVISDARKTTVSLDTSGAQGGAMLLETERRTSGRGEVVPS